MSGQQTLIFVEIDVPKCANTYGVAPCTASIPTTGDIKCFNTRKTCQDIANYVAGTPVTLRFAKPAAYRPADIFAFPFIASVDYTPAIVSLGKDLGQRASVSIVLEDYPDSDTFPGLDPYLSDRVYDPYSQGTFFGKFRARSPFILGAPLRLIMGYVGQELADMETRNFLIDSYEGPTPQGRFTIRASDVLKLGNADKALAPVMSQGYLVADITSSDASFTLTPTSIGANYPNAGYLNIGGSELVAFEHDPTAGNDANCILLIKASGADASTTFTDTSSSARALTANGNVQVDTAQFFFGNSSILFDGTGDFISAADAAAWTFAGNFTLECRSRFASLASARTLICHSTDINNMYRLYVTAAGALQFDVVSASVTIITLASATALITTSTWYHLAVVRNGNVFKLYIDGVEVATVTDTDAIPNFTSTFKIGISGNGSSDAMNGWIDMVRISNVARWTDDFDLLFDTGRYATSTDSVFITRAQLNTTAASHKAGDRAQLVLAYVGEDPADIIYDLCTTYIPGFDPAWIDLATWQSETTTYNGNVYTAYVTEPTSVKALIEELVLQAALAIWWDDVSELLRLQVLRAIVTTAFTFTPDNMRKGTPQIREQLDQRLSQVQIYFGQINPLLPLSNKDNYRSSTVVSDTDAEADWGQPAITTILSRWIPQTGRTVADRLGAIMLGRFKTPPRHVAFEVQRYAETDVDLGGGYHFENTFVQDETGASAGVFIPIQVTQLKPLADRFAVEAEEMLFDAPAADLTNRAVTIDANNFNINLRTAHDSIFPAPTGSETVTFTIKAGVLVGSVSTGSPAIDVGSWPAGTGLTLILEAGAEIQGKGGAGGAGGFAGSGGAAGGAGGVALYTRKAIALNSAGVIAGGGGGGGGGDTNFFTGGGGGGGGAGTQVGIGGASSGVGSSAGANGTASAGGAGGTGSPASGGAGGNPGAAGSAGGPASGGVPGAGGAAGAAVDGTSYVTYTVAGTITGSQIN